MGNQQKGQQKSAAPEERKLGSDDRPTGNGKVHAADRSNAAEPERPTTPQEDAAQGRGQPSKPSQAEGERD